MSERITYVALAAALAGCVGGRRVDIEFHTPRQCRTDPAPDVPHPCPLGAVRSLRTVLERVDGAVEHDGCQPAPAGLCRWEDLDGHLFVARAAPNDGVEITLTGWTDDDCGDAIAVRCETFGSAVIDLMNEDVVPLWCECPYVVPP